MFYCQVHNGAIPAGVQLHCTVQYAHYINNEIQTDP